MSVKKSAFVLATAAMVVSSLSACGPEAASGAGSAPSVTKSAAAQQGSTDAGSSGKSATKGTHTAPKASTQGGTTSASTKSADSKTPGTSSSASQAAPDGPISGTGFATEDGKIVCASDALDNAVRCFNTTRTAWKGTAEAQKACDEFFSHSAPGLYRPYVVELSKNGTFRGPYCSSEGGSYSATAESQGWWKRGQKAVRITMPMKPGGMPIRSGKYATLPMDTMFVFPGGQSAFTDSSGRVTIKDPISHDTRTISGRSVI